MAELKKTEKARLIKIVGSVNFSASSLNSGVKLSKERKAYIKTVSSKALRAVLAS